MYFVDPRYWLTSSRIVVIGTYHLVCAYTPHTQRRRAIRSVSILLRPRGDESLTDHSMDIPSQLNARTIVEPRQLKESCPVVADQQPGPGL
jgi:hypothetical protein